MHIRRSRVRVCPSVPGACPSVVAFIAPLILLCRRALFSFSLTIALLTLHDKSCGSSRDLLKITRFIRSDVVNIHIMSAYRPYYEQIMVTYEPVGLSQRDLFYERSLFLVEPHIAIFGSFISSRLTPYIDAHGRGGPYRKSFFLDASAHLYKRVCPSVRLFVR